MEVNDWITQNYGAIVKMSKNICKWDRNTTEELAHYALEQFLTNERAQELVDKDQAMLFMSGIMWRSYHSTTSPYHKLYRQSGQVVELYDKTRDAVPDEEYDIEWDLTIESIQGIMEDMESDTVEQWFRVVLFKMWLNNSNYSELSRQIGIPRTTISQAVKECREYIKKRIDNGTNN